MVEDPAVNLQKEPGFVTDQARILIVDDEPSVLMALEAGLEQSGCSIESVKTGEEALERFRKGMFDLVLVDKNLPGMDGVELIRKILLEDNDVALFMITGYPSVESALETLELGIDGYIAKPFDDIFEVTRKIMESVKRLKKFRDKTRRTTESGLVRTLTRARKAGGRIKKALEQTRHLAASQPEGRELTILVASPELSEVEFIARQLKGSRDKILFLTSADDVMEHARKNAPDVLILDACFKNPDIFELLQSFRAHTPQTCCVVLMEKPSYESTARLIDLEVSSVLSKPIDNVQFSNKITRLIQTLRFSIPYTEDAD
jgi:DNA-binding response OmpR family regulator